MRQAGRYLPQYQKFKDKYSLDQMFGNPEVAAEITCLPIDILKVDAAILFADILTLPQHLGFQISFSKEFGPLISNPIRSFEDIQKIRPAEAFPQISETIRLVNQRLPKDIPLIGFAGAPFTVLCYLLEGGSSVSFQKTLKFLNEKPELAEEVLRKLTDNTINYLNAQKTAGIRLFQLFDSWGGILRAADYERFVLPSVQKIFQHVQLPSIYYLKNSHHLLPLMKRCGADFLSVCQTIVLGQEPLLQDNPIGLQGNLFNGLLYSDAPTLTKEVEQVLLGAKNYSKYIFNLSHGVFPDTDVDQLKRIVDQVHQFEWKG